MLILLSPSKGQDFEPNALEQHTQPAMLEHSEVLAKQLKTFKPQQIADLMSVSENLAELNYERFQKFSTPFELGAAKQAALAFKGDVYNGLDAETMKQKDWDFAQKHLRILSGLYGYLKPLDLIMPYRLEMSTKLSNERGENLYQFWGERITDQLNQDDNSDQWVVNLASNEYYKAVKPKLLDAQVLNIDFKDTKAGKTRIISFYAKTARGQLAREIINHKITDIEQIKNLEFDGYKYRKDLSKDNKWVFERPQPAPKK